MLSTIYVHEQLAKVARHARPRDDHTFALASLRRRSHLGRRLAMLIGRGLHGVAEALLAYAGERPRRLSTPIPPVVELRPGHTPYSLN